MELALPLCIVPHDMSFSLEEVLVGLEAFEADRTPGMELAGRDAALCPDPLAEAIGEAGRAVAVDAR